MKSKRKKREKSVITEFDVKQILIYLIFFLIFVFFLGFYSYLVYVAFILLCLVKFNRNTLDSNQK